MTTGRARICVLEVHLARSDPTGPGALTGRVEPPARGDGRLRADARLVPVGLRRARAAGAAADLVDPAATG
jgi:hypothetical protein